MDECRLIRKIEMDFNRQIRSISSQQMEFIPEIKLHILSYCRKPKKMRAINLWKYQNSLGCLPYGNDTDKLFAKRIYKLRMLISKDQLQFETSEMAQKSQIKFKNDVLVKSNRRDVIADLKSYWENRLNTPWNITGSVCLIGYYERYCFSPFNKIINHLQTSGSILKAHLHQIEREGKNSTKKMRKRERVACECCGKDLARGSISRHMKKCA